MSARNMTAALILRLVDRLSAPARAAARAIGDVERSQKLAKRAGEQWTKGLEKLDQRLGSLAKASLATEGLGRAGQAMIRPLKASALQAADFSQGMTGIGITAQLSDRQLKPLRKTILDTAAAYKLLPTDVQKTFGAVLAEGVYKSVKDLETAGRALTKFQKLAQVMGDPVSDAEAGALSAAFGSSFKIKADQLDKANAMISKSAQLGGVGIGTVARFLPGQAGDLKSLSFANNVGLADLLAANQVSKMQAGSSDAAANNVSNLFQALARQDTIKNFNKKGINLEAEIKKAGKAGKSPLEALAEITKKATGGDKFRIGELVGDQQAGAALTALVNNLELFKSYSRDIQAEGTFKAYLADVDRASSGTAASLASYENAQKSLAISTGTLLAPATGWAADLLSKLANSLSAAEESGSPLAKVAVYAASGFAVLAAGTGKLGEVATGVLGPWLIMKSLFGDLMPAAAKGAGAGLLRFAATLIGPVIGAIRALSIALVTTPIGWIILAITAVAVAAYLIIKHWGVVKPWLVGFWNGFKAVVAIGWSWVKAAFAWTPLGVIVANWGRITGWLAGFWNGFKAIVATGWSWVKTAFAFTPLGIIVTNWGRIIGWLGGFWSRLRAGALIGWAVIKTLFAWSPLGLVIGNWSRIIAALVALTGRFRSIGAAMMQGLIAGIVGAYDAIKKAIFGAGDKVVGWFKSKLGIRSPSRVFAGLGDYTMQGLRLGIDRSGKEPVGAAARAATALVGAMAITAPGVAFAAPARAVASLSPASTIGALTASPVGAGGLIQAAAPGGREGAAGGASAPAPRAERPNLTQHFHIQGGNFSARELARELQSLSKQGQRAAMVDGDQG